MRIAWKLTLTLFAAACLALAVDTLFRIRRESAQLDAELRERHRDIARALTAPFAEVWQLDGEARAMDLVDRFNEAEGRVRVRWVWLDADASEKYQPRAELELLRPLAIDRAVTWDDLQDERRFTYVRVRLPDPRSGALELSESFDRAKRRLEATILDVVGATLSIALLFGVASMLVGVVAVGRPVRRMIELARRVGAGDLEARLCHKQNDELGELAQEMNVMADRLKEASDRAEREADARLVALEQLRHADRVITIGTLAAEIAHELGTPLNVVSAHAKMIANGEIEGDEARQGAREIAEQSSRMTTIIRQVLDFARHRPAERAPRNLWPIVQDASRLIEPLAQRRGVRLALVGDQAARYIARVNSVQIQQVLANLLVNGIQAMPDGGRLEVGIDGLDAIRLYVRDEGIGLPDVRLSQIFEPFFTTKPVGEGTGLGLAVVQSIVQDHGGRIHFDSPPGRGTTVSIYFPGEGQAL